jgi:putative ABC transport system permease protein
VSASLHFFYIAWRYLLHHRARSAIIVAVVSLLASLPLVLEQLLAYAEAELMARAQHTPLVAGAPGSALDLVMSTLYFGDSRPQSISFGAADRISETGFALALPVYVRFKARGAPIVATVIDYFAFRGLRVREGRAMALLGEAVAGAEAAARLGLRPGDALVTSPENAFDLAGVYPLKLAVVGVLERTSTADDHAIFVDLKTAWIIEGLGHGHEDLAATEDSGVILERGASTVTANARLMQYAEVTPENIGSFHFHGDIADYPISAVIAVPPDARAATLLRGRYLGSEVSEQIVVPREVIGALLAEIFRIKRVVGAVLLVAGGAAVLLLALVFALSLRLRQREIDTMYMIGASRTAAARLVAAEIAIIAGASATLTVALLAIGALLAPDLVRMVLAG